MEYSASEAIPVMADVDAGTIELIRSFSALRSFPRPGSIGGPLRNRRDQWVPSCICQRCRLVDQIKDSAFRFVGESIAAGKSIGEYDVQQFIMSEFARNSLKTDEPPIVGVNANSGNPHYTPTASKSARSIAATGSSSISGRSTRASRPFRRHYVDRHRRAVASAGACEDLRHCHSRPRRRRRTAARQAWQGGETLMGWQLDRVSRNVIEQAGYGERFFHRTGHSMGPAETPHAPGVNLDDLETHDTRPVVPGVGFSVEPGIYLPEFGVRSEIDVYMHPKNGPTVTTPMQAKIICMP